MSATPGARVHLPARYRLQHALLRATRRLPVANARRHGRWLTAATRLVPGLRGRVRTTMARALGASAVPAHAADQFFDNFGQWSVLAMQVYHHGLESAGALDRIEVDDTLSRLHEAKSLGKGVVAAIPHLFGHEMIAGVAWRNGYPVVSLIRESPYEAHNRVKLHWYRDALGGEVVIRPRKANMTADMRVCIKVLREDKLLGITPDLVAGEEGVEVTLFGRRIALPPGVVTLSMYTGAPLVPVYIDWRGERFRIRFDEPLTFPRGGDREHTVRVGMQRWCDGFEAHLRAQPASWKFWLDRRWASALGDRGAAGR